MPVCFLASSSSHRGPFPRLFNRMNLVTLLLLLLVALVSVARAEDPAASGSVAAPSPAEGETVDLRHHWKRPYTYGYGNNYYGYSSYPSGYSGYNYYPSYQHQQQYYQPFYPSNYGGQQHYGYSNYYSNSYEYGGGNYYGLGYREGDKNKDTPAAAAPAPTSGDEIKFH